MIKFLCDKHVLQLQQYHRSGATADTWLKSTADTVLRIRTHKSFTDGMEKKVNQVFKTEMMTGSNRKGEITAITAGICS